jgi:16S rRNA (guanine527-N7)-methyltransferase
METARIAELLQPFLREADSSRLKPARNDKVFASDLSQAQLDQIAAYLDLLLLWNARINLTSVREPEAIITRHFGESIFAARHIFPESSADHIIDLGSGAGFPGLPIKIVWPDLRLTLIEANQKKGTFLREVVRKLELTNVEVFSGRGEDYSAKADVVTFRAVERFEQALRLACNLINPGGRAALLIGSSQVELARRLTPQIAWNDPLEVPLSSNRVLLIGTVNAESRP